MSRNKEPLRKVHIDGEVWHYSHGGTRIFAPNSKIPMKLNGKEYHDIKVWHTPSEVKQYIIDNLVTKRLKEGIA